MRRGPSTISTPLARKIGRGLPAPNGASDVELRRHLLVDGPEPQRAVDPDPRTEIVRLQAAVGVVVDAGAQLPDTVRRHRQAGGLLVSAELAHHLAARFERRRAC